MAGARAAVQVGVAAAVNQSAEGEAPGAGKRTLTLGDSVIHNEHVVTGPDGLVNILLVDGTSFTVGANSDLTIDSFVYDPDAGTATVVATLAKGALRFIGGRTSKTGGATINTPVGTVGIRGGVGDFSIGQGDGSGGVPENLVNCVYGSCSVTDSNGTTTKFDAGHVRISGRRWRLHCRQDDSGNGGRRHEASWQPPWEERRSQPADAATARQRHRWDGYGSTGNPPPNPPTYFTSDTKTGAPTNYVQDANKAPTLPPTNTTPHEPINVRVLTAGDTFELPWGKTIPDDDANPNPPGAVGLVGGPGHDQVVNLTFSNTSTPNVFLGTGTVGGQQFQFPIGFNANTGLGATLDYSIPNSPRGPLEGSLFTRGDFNFLSLFYDHVIDEATYTYPIYALAGTPTDFEAVFLNQGQPTVRRYELGMDPIQQVPVPFFRDGLIDSFANAANSDALSSSRPRTAGSRCGCCKPGCRSAARAPTSKARWA